MIVRGVIKRKKVNMARTMIISKLVVLRFFIKLMLQVPAFVTVRSSQIIYSTARPRNIQIDKDQDRVRY